MAVLCDVMGKGQRGYKGRGKKRRLTELDTELARVGRELEKRAEEAWREWMFGGQKEKPQPRCLD